MPKTLTTNELTVLGRVDILCGALEKDYENDSIRLHESSLRDEMHYSPCLLYTSPSPRDS